MQQTILNFGTIPLTTTIPNAKPLGAAICIAFNFLFLAFGCKAKSNRRPKSLVLVFLYRFDF
ncbi:hypothetical protein BDZ91DRAFT_715570 [Kalaharituber pfeilii]|nr:hypothetical protein BDZ91DRAFT_715570 [Kalaharituber pfeilii]